MAGFYQADDLTSTTKVIPDWQAEDSISERSEIIKLSLGLVAWA